MTRALNWARVESWSDVSLAGTTLDPQNRRFDPVDQLTTLRIAVVNDRHYSEHLLEGDRDRRCVHCVVRALLANVCELDWCALNLFCWPQRLDIVYRHGEVYDPTTLARIDQYLRDYHTGDVPEFDPRVFDLLHDLVVSVGDPDAQIQIVCGYRTPHTNEYLRTHGHGVARHSCTCRGWQSIFTYRECQLLRDAALALHRGGVGYCASSNFIHVDTGRVRRW